MNKDGVNTVFAGYSTLALSAYSQAYQTTNKATFSISETFADGKQKSLVAPDSTYEKVSVDDLVKQISFMNSSKQPYFYQLTQAGFDKKQSADSLKQGLEVYREYRDTDGTLLTQTALGSEIEVHIRLRALDNRYLSNIAVVDLLPGGFEVVRDSVKPSNMEYADVREDRVIFFGGASSEAKEIVYRIKATNPGEYGVPGVFASSMYDLKIKARGVGGRFLITEGA